MGTPARSYASFASSRARSNRLRRASRESSLHRALKERYAGDACAASPRSGRATEVTIDRFRIDVVREGELIEIQTRSFSSIRRKLCALLDSHPVRLVYPIPCEKWVVHVEPNGNRIKRRKSPRRGSLIHLFDELVSFPQLMVHPNLSLEVLLTREEEIRCADGRGSWRRKGCSIVDRRLIEVIAEVTFAQPVDFLRLLPEGLPDPFSSRDLAMAMRQTVAFARRVTYCLREMQAIRLCGRRGRTYLYQRT
jgi:hypothetical protein